MLAYDFEVRFSNYLMYLILCFFFIFLRVPYLCMFMEKAGGLLGGSGGTKCSYVFEKTI